MSSNEEDFELTPLRGNERDTDTSDNSSDQEELTGVVVDPNNAEENLIADDLEPTMAEKLIQAFKENNVDEVKRIVEQENITVSTRLGSKHFSIIHLAALYGSVDILRALPASGCGTTTNDVDREGRTPLHCAVWMGHKECVSFLVEQCPHLVNQPVETSRKKGTLKGLYHVSCPGMAVTDTMVPSLRAGLTPLHLASQKADIECVRLLLAARADCNALDGNKLTPLDTVGENISEDKYEMASKRFLQVINALCTKGGKPTTEPNARYRQTPMHIAVSLDCVDAIPVLAKTGYNTPIKNKAGDTALHIAARQRSKDPTKCPLTKLVSLYGLAGVECKNNSGENPLHIVVQKQWLSAVKTLLKSGADVTVETSKKKTVLHLAAKNHVIMAELLKHPDSQKIVDKLDPSGNTPLLLSIHEHNCGCVASLLKHRANVKLQDSNGRTVLHCAIENKHTQILEVLFNHDMRAMKEIIDMTIKGDQTALHIAADKNNYKGAEILVKYGCDLKKKAIYEGYTVTALQWATMKGYGEIVKLLVKADCSLVHIGDKEGRKPIHWACIKRNRKIITSLVDAGSDLSAKCIYPGQTFETTAMDLLIHRVPCSVALLEKCMDSSFKVKNTLISIDYKILLPNEMPKDSNSNIRNGQMKVQNAQMSDDSNANRCNDQMKVLNALVQTGDQVNQHSLFMHPLIESFLYLQWKRISILYYLLIFDYMVLVISFSSLILVIFCSEEKDLSNNPLYALIIFLRVVIAISSCIHIPHEVLYMSHKHRNSTSYSLRWILSTLKKKSIVLLHLIYRLAKIVFMVVIIVITVIDPTNRDMLPREVATGAILLFWVQFMLVASRVPTYGLYMLMFFEVTSNFFVVLSSFTFLIVAFMITFLIEFQAKPPFDSKSEAFLKTIVMMTNEFEYNDLFNTFEGNITALVFTKLVFLFFVLLVGIVIMNILLAKAILEVKKVDRLRKQAQFLSTYENLFGCLQRLCFKTTAINSKLKIHFDLQDPQFPTKLMHIILDKAYAVNDAIKQSYKDKPQIKNGSRIDSCSSSEVEPASSESLPSNNQPDKPDPFTEMNKKIDLLTKKIDQLSQRASLCSQCLQNKQ